MCNMCSLDYTKPDTHIKQELYKYEELESDIIGEENVIIEGMNVDVEEVPRMYNKTVNQVDSASGNNENLVSQVRSDIDLRESYMLLEAVDCGLNIKQEVESTEDDMLIVDDNYQKNVKIKNIELKLLVSNSEVKIVDEKKTYQCTFCHFKAKSKRSLRQHVNYKHNRKETKCYSCKFCDYSTKYRSSLTRHFKLKHDTDQVVMYQCEFCDYRTKLKCNLVTHVDVKHEKSISSKPPRELLCCLFCKYETKQKNHLKRHVEVTHYDMPEFKDWHQCESCEYKTKRKSHLIRHVILKHDDAAKLYECQFCKFKTKQNSHLKRHLKIKHDDSAIWHQCHLCDFSTKHKSYLTQHAKRKHVETTEHENSSKQKSFIHSKVEHKEKTCFQCVFCAYKTTNKAAFLEHYKVKHDAEPEWFCCYHCEYKVLIKQHLVLHISRKHGNKKLN